MLPLADGEVYIFCYVILSTRECEQLVNQLIDSVSQTTRVGVFPQGLELLFRLWSEDTRGTQTVKGRFGFTVDAFVSIGLLGQCNFLIQAHHWLKEIVIKPQLVE